MKESKNEDKEFLRGFNKGKEAVKELLFHVSDGHDEDRELFILSLGQLFSMIDGLTLKPKDKNDIISM